MMWHFCCVKVLYKNHIIIILMAVLVHATSSIRDLATEIFEAAINLNTMRVSFDRRRSTGFFLSAFIGLIDFNASAVILSFVIEVHSSIERMSGRVSRLFSLVDLIVSAINKRWATSFDSGSSQRDLGGDRQVRSSGPFWYAFSISFRSWRQN